MIRPILDGIIVRMEPPRERVGSIVIPETARAEQGTWRAQREAKIGTVLAVGTEGRRRPRRTTWERDRRKTGPLKPDELARQYDAGSEGERLHTGVAVGDRVLFDNAAELRPADPADPLVWQGAAYQVAAVLDRADSVSGVEFDYGAGGE